MCHAPRSLTFTISLHFSAQICGHPICRRSSKNVPCDRRVRPREVGIRRCCGRADRNQPCRKEILVRPSLCLLNILAHSVSLAPRETPILPDSPSSSPSSLPGHSTFFSILSKPKNNTPSLRNRSARSFEMPTRNLTFHSCQTSGKPGAQTADDTKQIAELKKKLAASEAKERDFGTDSCYL